MPAVDNPNSVAASIPGQIAQLRKDLKDLSVNRAFSPSSWHVGTGGLIVDGTTTLTGAATLTGGISGPVTATGAVSGASIAAGGAVSGGTVSATGAVSGASITATGAVSGGTVSATGAVSGASIAATGNATVGGNTTVTGQIFAANAFAAVSGYTVAYFNVDGRLSLGASALVFKQDFEPVDHVPLVEAILRVPLLRFRLIAAVEEMGDKATLEIGLLADYLTEIGLGEFVYRDKNGDIAGINYERLTIPLIATVQSMDARLKALESISTK